MPKDIYIHEEQTRHSWVRRVLVLTLFLALAAGLAAGAYLIRTEQSIERAVETYEAALADHDYQEALSLYRRAQERALASGPLQQHNERHQQVMQEIEAITQSQIDDVLVKMRSGQMLTEQEIAFVADMEEVTAVHIVQEVRRMAAGFVAGDVSRPALERVFEQLAALDNLRPAIGSLPDQMDQMIMAEPYISKARTAIDEGDYWTAHELYMEVLDDDTMGVFVHEQTQLWIEACEAQMYDPLIQIAETLKEGGRYLSAVESLERLSEVYPNDARIASMLSAARPYVPELVRTQLNPEFISIRPLIIDTDRAFDGDAYAVTANDAMITAAEFKAILRQLYENDYILIDSNIIYDQDRMRRTLEVPPGKKPLVLVIDGLNYYASRRETGNAWDLVIDENGDVSALYPDARGDWVVDREGEMIGLLDNFVRQHPDFSLNGAKGTISLSGYECIFGKVTDRSQVDQRNRSLQENNHNPESLSDADIAANKEEVMAIMQRLKETGWVFASSTYGYINASEHSLERIIDDTEKWLDQVGSLTGPVTMLNYPNGAFIPGADERSQYLREQGFVLFGSLGVRPYFVTPDTDALKYHFVDKTPINGFSLRNSGHYALDRFFDASSVYDAENRP